MDMTRVAIGKKSGKAFDIVRAHDSGFIVLRDDGNEYLLPYESCKAVMLKQAHTAALEAEAGQAYQQINPIEPSQDTWDPKEDVFQGFFYLEFDPGRGPQDPNDKSYLAAVREEALAHLNHYKSSLHQIPNPEAPDQPIETKSGLTWSDAEIDVKYVPRTPPESGVYRVTYKKPNASATFVNYIPEAKKGDPQSLSSFKFGEAEGRMLLNFLADNGFRPVASASNVAESFVEGKASDTAGDMKLLHGVVYSYAIPIGANYKGKFYVNLKKYSKTTSVHQNALVDVLDRGNHPYKEVSEDQILEAAAKAFTENIRNYKFQKEESDWEEEEGSSGSKASSGSKGSEEEEGASGSGSDALERILSSRVKDPGFVKKLAALLR